MRRSHAEPVSWLSKSFHPGTDPPQTHGAFYEVPTTGPGLSTAQMGEPLSLAGQTSPVPPVRHSHIVVVVQPGRTLVPRVTDKALRRGVFHSEPDLIGAIEDLPRRQQQRAQAVRLTLTADGILAKVNKGRRTTSSYSKLRHTTSGHRCHSASHPRCHLPRLPAEDAVHRQHTAGSYPGAPSGTPPEN